jgi:hypothetical protein
LINQTWTDIQPLSPAGGGAYYFAKKSINADRASRHQADMKRRAELAAMENADRQRNYKNKSSLPSTAGSRDNVGSPSTEATTDPAATRHEPDTDQDRLWEKSKYEAAETFRPPRGNRFS